MSLIAAIMAAPLLAGTGIYNPPVVDQYGNCTAAPGSFDAIYCSGREAPGKRKQSKKQ
jgi:hypothetical protein